MTHLPPIPWEKLETHLRRDPARRGLGAWQDEHGALCPGALERAARCLAHEESGDVAIVTGFCVADAAKPAGETDGPPGALYLARALMEQGRGVLLISDAYGLPLLEAGVDRWGLGRPTLCEFPFEAGEPESPARASNDSAWNARSDAWVREFFAGRGRNVTCVVSTERVGPSHTLDSLAAQPRSGEAPRETFERDVPQADRNRCHNMRGLDITGYTAKTHRLLEIAREQPRRVTTIGIGDGGNELGLGSIAWETLRAAVEFSPGARIACRIATNHTILAGVSNWGAYALALATTILSGRAQSALRWDEQVQRDLIEAMVRETDAVDGATKRREATVDGLPLETYLQGLVGLRHLLGL